jgi:ribosomal protein L11 methyltransferase
MSTWTARLLLLPIVTALHLPTIRRAPPPCLCDKVDIRLVSLQCPPELSAAVLSDALIEAGALYVSVGDGNEGTPEEEPLFAAHSPGSEGPVLESWDELMAAKKLWSNSTLEVGFAPSADVERAMINVIADAGQSFSYGVEDLAPKDWVGEVQSNWPPVALPNCLTIKFPWHGDDEVDPRNGPIVTLHPGMAFGTGEHQTTQLCCTALKEILDDPATRGSSVLDYGSGSGILSFAALHFGAGKAVGVEIDEEALTTSRANAAENGFECPGTFTALLPEEEEELGETYPIVVANILAGTLVELSSLLASRVAPGGHLLMSGIWEGAQVERVIDAFSRQGLDPYFTVEYAEGGWALVRGTKPLEANKGLKKGLTSKNFLFKNFELKTKPWEANKDKGLKKGLTKKALEKGKALKKAKAATPSVELGPPAGMM